MLDNRLHSIVLLWKYLLDFLLHNSVNVYRNSNGLPASPDAKENPRIFLARFGKAAGKKLLVVTAHSLTLIFNCFKALFFRFKGI